MRVLKKLMSILKVVGVILLGSFILGGLLTFGARYIKYRDDVTPKHFEIGDNLTVNGNVGIETTSPEAQLDIEAEVPSMHFTENDQPASDQKWLIAGYNGELQFQPRDSTGGGFIGNALRLQRDLGVSFGGNVGIGTTGPGEKLEVAGNIKLSGASPTYKITNVAAPTANSDVATKEYVDASAGGVWDECYAYCYEAVGGNPSCKSGFTEVTCYSCGSGGGDCTLSPAVFPSAGNLVGKIDGGLRSIETLNGMVMSSSLCRALIPTWYGGCLVCCK